MYNTIFHLSYAILLSELIRHSHLPRNKNCQYIRNHLLLNIHYNCQTDTFFPESQQFPLLCKKFHHNNTSSHRYPDTILIHTKFHLPSPCVLHYTDLETRNPDTCNHYNQIHNNCHLFLAHDYRLAHSDTHISIFHSLPVPTSNHLLILLHCPQHCYLTTLFPTVIQTQLLTLTLQISFPQIRSLLPLIAPLVIVLLVIPLLLILMSLPESQSLAMILSERFLVL